jgi:chromosome segregation ATPase
VITSQHRSKSEQALNELEFLTQRLQEGRENITRAETEHNLLRRELELTRHAHQEELAMSEVEQHNLQVVRSRLVELKHEVSETEQHLLVCKESALKEEDKLRKTKALATDQLRLLQMDLNNIQSDFKVKQRQIEDLERHRRAVDEEIEVRRRDSELQLSATSRELEEETRKLNNHKNDGRVCRRELEQLVNKRRQLEGELTRLQDAFNAENARCSAEEQEARRKLLQYEKQNQAADKDCRDLKGKISALEGEEVT